MDIWLIIQVNNKLPTDENNIILGGEGKMGMRVL